MQLRLDGLIHIDLEQVDDEVQSRIVIFGINTQYTRRFSNQVSRNILLNATNYGIIDNKHKKNTRNRLLSSNIQIEGIFDVVSHKVVLR